MSKGRLMDLLKVYIPDRYLDSPRGPEKWVHRVEDCYKRVCYYCYAFILSKLKRKCRLIKRGRDLYTESYLPDVFVPK